VRSIDQSEFVRPPHGRLIVVANRAPVSHQRTSDGRIVATHSASGLVTALDPLVTTHGTWVAHGAGDADRLVVDGNDGILVQIADDIAGAAHALHGALSMSEREQATRMRLRAIVRKSSAQRWAEQLLHDAYRQPRRTPANAADRVPSAARIPA
jgi:trehalose-6-phosphate synthase